VISKLRITGLLIATIRATSSTPGSDRDGKLAPADLLCSGFRPTG